jgi:hypothetical protein
VFNINWDKTIKLLLPVHLRRQRTLAFLKALSRPLKNLYNGFINYRRQTLRTVSHTGQVMYLEQLLNDLYSPSHRGIEIVDSDDDRFPAMLYNAAEGQLPVYVYNKLEEEEEPYYLRNIAEYYNLIDFIVRVPNGLSVSPAIIRNWVNRYRQAGKRFILQYYNQGIG